jgi:hypothetical protein
MEVIILRISNAFQPLSSRRRDLGGSSTTTLIVTATVPAPTVTATSTQTPLQPASNASLGPTPSIFPFPLLCLLSLKKLGADNLRERPRPLHSLSNNPRNSALDRNWHRVCHPSVLCSQSPNFNRNTEPTIAQPARHATQHVKPPREMNWSPLLRSLNQRRNQRFMGIMHLLQEVQE